MQVMLSGCFISSGASFLNTGEFSTLFGEPIRPIALFLECKEQKHGDRITF